MFDEFEKDDRVSVSYTSDRSENTVSRTGTVLQTPTDEKNGFFVKTDDNQWTAVMDNRVNSITVDTDGDEPEIQRQTYVGEFESVEAQ